MTEVDVTEALTSKLNGLDEDILNYLIAIVDGLSITERKTSHSLYENISPFLLDSGFASDDDAAMTMCKDLAIAFGGSGYSSAVKGPEVDDDETPVLLSAPVKIRDNTEYMKGKQTFMDVTVFDSFGSQNAPLEYVDGAGNSSGSQPLMVNGNQALDVKAIPTTQKEMRKQRKQNEQLNKILRMEALARAKAEQEMAQARMAAIKASRTQGRQANNGVNIERFSIPHPSGSSDLLTDATLVLAPGRRYGLIGKNGAGKSTLMRMLANYKLPGLMHLRILLVDQHVEGDDESALQWVLRADVERTALLEEEQKLNMYLHGADDNTEEADEGTTKRGIRPVLPPELKGVNLEVALQEVYERMDAIGVPTAELRARKILEGLGFSNEMMERPTNSLSGGWAMRAALAAALFVKPNLLLLDEPTNHLDLHALVWLEHWLVNYFRGIVLTVSHDQVFLDSICTDILELKSTLVGHSKSSLTHYSGDYSTYQNTLEEQRIAQERQRLAYEKEKEKLQEFIAREGKKYDNPAHQAQRKMKMKQLEKLIEVEKVETESELVLHFPKPYCVFDDNETLISVKDLGFAWTNTDENGNSTSSNDAALEYLFENVDFTVNKGARIAILGKNGCGKTSLLNILSGEWPATKGTVKRHLGSRITVLHQHHYKGEQLDPNLTPLDHMRRIPQSDSTAVGLHDPGTRQEETAQRSYLSNFGIVGPRATIPVKYLSGGQRMRVALAVAFYRRPDLLILDEPTNHLDAETVKALCDALQTYEGAIITVSHDEAYVNRVISQAVVGDAASKKEGLALQGELWVMSKQQLQRFDGTFKEYKKQVLKKLLRSDDLDSLFTNGVK